MQKFTFSVDRARGFTPPETPERGPNQPAYVHTLVDKPRPSVPFVVQSVIYRGHSFDFQFDEFCDRMHLIPDDRSTAVLNFVFPDLSRNRNGKDFEDYPLNPLMVATARQRSFYRHSDDSLVTAQINFSGMGYVMPHHAGNEVDPALYEEQLHPMHGHFDPSGQRIGKIHIEA